MTPAPTPRSQRPLAAALAAALAAGALAAAGCLAPLPGGPPPECHAHDDCNTAAGEVCDLGVCWGDPPPGTFAVVIGPPPERPDLAPTEVAAIAIAPDGWIEDLRVAPASTLRGRIEAACDGCRDGVTIPATIHVRRASRIPGGPDYLASVGSTAGAAGDSFTLAVPAIGPDDPPYRLTIEPSATEPLYPDGPTPAQLVPPLRLTVAAGDLGSARRIVLDAEGLRVVTGRIVDGVGAGIAGMRVSALGRLDPLRPLERVSTIATTDGQGWFTLLLGADVLEVVDVVAQPPAGTVAPTLIAQDRFTGAPEPLLLQMPVYPGAARISVPVRYVDPSGAEQAVDSARVKLTTVIAEGVPGDPGLRAVYTVEGFTSGGLFTADVIAGSATAPRPYVARITPPADALAAAHATLVEVGEQGGVLATVRLALRASVTGKVLDAEGRKVGSAVVQARPSLHFVWTLDDRTQSLLEDRAPPSAVTAADGRFTVWVDPVIPADPLAAGEPVPAEYDLECIPPEESRLPRWTMTGVAPSSCGPAAVCAELGELWLPDGASVRARVLDPGGAPIQGARVQVYRVEPEGGPCIAENAPDDCQPPAVLRAAGHSGPDGTVALVLPR